MPRYPAMDAGELTLARLSGSARSRGYPAMRDARTAADLTGGDWQRKRQGWGVDDKSRARPSTSTTVPALARSQDMLEAAPPRPAVTSEKFTPGGSIPNFGLVGTVDDNGDPLLKPAPDAPSADTELPPADDSIVPGGFGDFMPPPMSTPTLPPASTSSAPATSSSSAGSALTVGLLVLSFFLR